MSALRTPVVFVACLAILIAASSRPSDAAPITGSLDVSGVNVGMDGADLAVSTLVTGTDMVATASAGDLGSIAVGTSFGPLELNTTNLLASFTFENDTYGSFIGSSAFITEQNADQLTLYFLGTFTPGPDLLLLGLDPTLVRLDVKVERFSVGEGDFFLDATLVLSPEGPAVPEPAMLGLLAIGGLALARRRHVARR